MCNYMLVKVVLVLLSVMRARAYEIESSELKEEFNMTLFVVNGTDGTCIAPPRAPASTLEVKCDKGSVVMYMTDSVDVLGRVVKCYVDSAGVLECGIVWRTATTLVRFAAVDGCSVIKVRQLE